MHILITVNAAWNIWNFRRGLVHALIADGHRITLLAPADEAVPKLKDIGVRFIHLDMNVKGLNPIDDIALLYNFNRIFQMERPDLILGYTIKNNIFGSVSAQYCKIPFIPTVTGLGTAFLSNGALQAMVKGLYRWSFRHLSVVFFQNPEDRDMFVSLGLVECGKAHVLGGSGIDLAEFAITELPERSDVLTFLFIGRLLRDKGVMELVDAARLIKAKFPATRIQLLGPADSSNRSAISAETIQKWVNEGLVEYLGSTNDVRPYIATAHCVVLPSYREGAPRTLIEAAAMARPVIATDVPGCRSVVENGSTGFLCEARNCLSLASCMEKFMKLLPEQMAKMGKAGRKKMEREYDEVIIVRAYRDAIAALQPINY